MHTPSQLLARTGLKVNDRVVCIDDTYQRPDLAHTPEGLLARGKIYCVSGASECGGVLLAGLRAISVGTGKEIGFDPSRFMDLECFRKQYPNAASFVSGTDSEVDLPSDPGLQPTRIKFPAIAGVENPKPVVLQVIEVLEELWHRFNEVYGHEVESWGESLWSADQSPLAVRNELLALISSPLWVAYLNLSWILWQRVLRYQQPVLLFCRTLSPAASVLFHMTGRPGVLSEKFLRGDIEDRDITMLIPSAGRLCNAPMRICDAREPEVFLRVLMAGHRSFRFAVCDWELRGEEAAAAYRITKDARISFLCPVPEPLEDREGPDAWPTDEDIP